MKALIITPFFPYQNVKHAGGRFVFEAIRGLSKRHEIHLFSRIEPDEKEHKSEIEPFCEGIELYEFKTPDDSNPLKPFLITASYIILAIRANRMIRKGGFDIVQVEHTETGLFIRNEKDAVLILDAHDVISKPALRRYLSAEGKLRKFMGWVKWRVVKRIEKYIACKFDMTFTRSEIDKDVLLGMDSSLNVGIVPHPVEVREPRPDMNRDDTIILFAGAMNRDLNQDAALYFYRSVFPLVKKEIPAVAFYIVGNSPPERIRELAMNDRDVVVTGYVDSLIPFYQRASVFVSPILIGGGIIAKNIEAMACGLPVVTTSRGNEGIEAISGRDILIADTPADFRDKVLLLLKNKEMRNTIGESGRRFINERFNLQHIIDIIEHSWREVTIKNRE